MAATTMKPAKKKAAKAKPEILDAGGGILVEIATPPAKATKAKATTPAKKKLSQIDAALQLLRNADEPMTCKEMVETMAKKKLWSSPGGKTPEATLYASILRDLHKDEPRFEKAAPGKFTAKA
ncbi:MAG: winged helix-turn-helix domain-containing protein [Bacteroidales bacterium]|nr:winged helix-turn-helix domain-containing protein [Bacteroidales bacterium]